MKKSLHNEDRNLLRIRERERRNQEAHQEKEPFQDNLPLFGEPYKTAGDELSSRIQSMLGNYEEVKEFISNKSHQDLIGIPKNAVPLTPHGKSDRPFFTDKTSTVPQTMRHTTTNKVMGPPVSAPSLGSCYGQFQKRPHTAEQPTNMHTAKSLSSHSRSQVPDLRHSNRENYSSRRHGKSDGYVDVDSCAKLISSHSKPSPPLPSLSPPAEPLSPLHSSQHSNSKSQNSNNHEKSTSRTKSPRVSDVVVRKENRDSSSLTVASQPSTQTFPPSLPSKTIATQQKPTAYVRPMDGQDQMPSDSPELKPTPEDYHEQSYEKIADIKANSKAKLSKLKIAIEPIEPTLSNEAHCVEEILREMTQSWPAPLTAIHTPCTAEPSKFPFPVKEPQHVPTVPQSQKHHDSSPKTVPSSKQAISMLEDDLQLSDSDESVGDQVSEKPVPSSAPPSAPVSQPDSVVSTHSSNRASDSSSETTDSSSESDSESESSSTASEEIKPIRTAILEGPPRVNSWQLDNWLPRVNPAVEHNCALADNPGHQESKEQCRTGVSLDLSEPHEPQPKTVNKEPRTAQEDCPSRGSWQKSPAHNDDMAQRQTVGTKQPKKPNKVLKPQDARVNLKSKSESSSHRVKDASSKEKPRVKKDSGLKMSEQKQPKPPPVSVTSDKTKHKGSDRSAFKLSSNCDSDREEAPSCPHEHPSAPVILSRTSDQKPPNKGLPQYKSLPPLKESRLISSDKVNQTPHTLIVKIDLSLLSRIPKPPGKSDYLKKSNGIEPSSRKKDTVGKENTEKPLNDSHRKRKGEEEPKPKDTKKLKLDKDSKSSSSSNQKESSKIKVSKSSCETKKKEPLPRPMSPARKPDKAEHKRRNIDSSTSIQVSTASASASTVKKKSSHSDSSSSKYRKTEDGRSAAPSNSKEPSVDNTNPFSVPSLPNMKSKSARPLLKFEDKKYDAEHHMKDAKKLKHKADAMEMSDKVGKAFTYLDAALSFIECAIALESDTQTPKSGYTMFSETVDLLKFTIKLKTFVDSSSSAVEKPFAVLSLRCLSLLYMAMFRYKKDTAIKYSRALNEHFKSSSRAAQAPSPCVARSTGTPSPLSPTPSPASSGSSQPGSNASNSSGSSVTIPQMIHQMASSYVNITSLVLYAHDTWEQADTLTKNSKEFFAELDAAMSPLALNSSMTELVHYTRQGLHWLRLDTNTL